VTTANDVYIKTVATNCDTNQEPQGIWQCIIAQVMYMNYKELLYEPELPVTLDSKQWQTLIDQKVKRAALYQQMQVDLQMTMPNNDTVKHNSNLHSNNR